MPCGFALTSERQLLGQLRGAVAVALLPKPGPEVLHDYVCGLILRVLG